MISETDWAEALQHEEKLAQLLKVRAEKSKPWWERSGIIPAVTGLLTLLLTSGAGYALQKSLKDRENAFALMRERTQLGRDAAKRANSAIASMLKVNEERTRMVRGEFDNLTKPQLHDLSEGTNRLQQDWRRQREDAEIDLFLVFDSASAVSPAWTKVRNALDDQVACIERVYIQTQGSKAKSPVCANEAAISQVAVSDFRSRIRRGYQRLAAQQ